MPPIVASVKTRLPVNHDLEKNFVFFFFFLK